MSLATPSMRETLFITSPLLELTYKAQLAPWMWLQPTLQRIYNPQSGTPNATVLGMMMTLTF